MRISLALVLVMASCGGGSADLGPFHSPEVPPDDPLILEVAGCSGGEDATRECIVDRVCDFAFANGPPRRFHLRPVGVAPWIQVELGRGGAVESIDVAYYGVGRADYSVGLSCAQGTAPPEELALEPLRDIEAQASGDLLTLPEDERTHGLALTAFGSAEDGQRVFQYCLWLARSSDPSDHALLADGLKSRAVVELLGNTTIDRGPRYRFEPRGHRWPLAQTLFTLRDSEAPSARALLAELSADALWADENLDMPDGHIDWLILALESQRPPSPGVLSYWRAHARPDDGYANLTVIALVRNATDESLTLYAALLRDRRFEYEDRALWFRQDLAARRNDAEALGVAERVLALRLPPRLERRFLEDLFTDWTDDIRPDTGLVCPSLALVPPEAAVVLRRIAERALAERVPRGLRAAIEAGVAELGNGDQPPSAP